MYQLNHEMSVPGVPRWDWHPDDAPSLSVRLSVLCRRGQLDRLLAEGASPEETPELALRARQLLSERNRRILADGFDKVLQIAEETRPGRTARPPLARREVRASRAALLTLARELRTNAHARPAGVALAQRLLTDGAGPLYCQGDHDVLWHAVRGATAALLGEEAYASPSPVRGG